MEGEEGQELGLGGSQSLVSWAVADMVPSEP